MEDAVGYVARLMGIKRSRAIELTGLANDAVEEVLDNEHIVDQSPEREAILEHEKRQVDLDQIAATLNLAVNEFRSWTEDEMIFIEYGQNLSDGIASEGPTALSATANFYCRWYNEVIVKHRPVLLSDDKLHDYNKQGEA